MQDCVICLLAHPFYIRKMTQYLAWLGHDHYVMPCHAMSPKHVKCAISVGIVQKIELWPKSVPSVPMASQSHRNGQFMCLGHDCSITANSSWNSQKWPIYVSWPWLFNYSQFILELSKASKASNSHPSSSKLCMQTVFIEHCMYHYSTVIINQLEIPIECVRQITRYTKSFKTHSSRLARGFTSGIYSQLCLTHLHASLVITLRRSLWCRLCTIHPSVSHCMYDTYYAK